MSELIEKCQEPDDLTSRVAMNMAAVDMNDVMGLEPPIDITLPDDMFFKAFRKASEFAEGTDSFKDYTWHVLEALGLGPERVPPKQVKGKKKPADTLAKVKTPVEKQSAVANKEAAAQVVSKKLAPKKEEPPKEPAQESAVDKAPKKRQRRSVGVVATIDRYILGKLEAGELPVKVRDVHKALVAAFPDRDQDSLMSTVRTQIPHRACARLKLTFERVSPGVFNFRSQD